MDVLKENKLEEMKKRIEERGYVTEMEVRYGHGTDCDKQFSEDIYEVFDQFLESLGYESIEESKNTGKTPKEEIDVFSQEFKEFIGFQLLEEVEKLPGIKILEGEHGDGRLIFGYDEKAMMKKYEDEGGRPEYRWIQ